MHAALSSFDRFVALLAVAFAFSSAHSNCISTSRLRAGVMMLGTVVVSPYCSMLTECAMCDQRGICTQSDGSPTASAVLMQLTVGSFFNVP